MQTLETARQRTAAAGPSVELVLAGNGPGELAGWIRPTAEAARAAASADGQALRLTLALLPTQFAGGAEYETVQSWRLFDRIISPSECVRLAAGMAIVHVVPHAVLVHLGGDLWLSSRLASRLRIPACAFSETTLIASRHRGFQRVFVPTETHAASLRGRGVPAAKIVVTGDPRAAAPAQARRMAGIAAARSEIAPEVIALLPGSRERFVRAIVPMFLDMAAALAAIRPGVTFQVIAAPFISPHALETTQREAATRWPSLPARWVTGDAWPDLVRATVAVTLPGTTTMELAAGGVPFVLVLPVDHIGLTPVEGPLEWVARITGLQRPLKELVLRRYRARMKFLALPNQRAGREVAPEWIGRWGAREIANRLNSLLDGRRALTDMATSLAHLYEADAAAPSRIVDSALAVAGQARGTRA